MSLHKTLEGYVTGEACLQYITKDIGLLSRCPLEKVSPDNIINNSIYVEHVYQGSDDSGLYRAYTIFNNYISKLPNNKSKRIIGLILDENDDGSFQVAILGNDDIEECYGSRLYYEYSAIGDSEKVPDTLNTFTSNLQPLFVYDVDFQNDVGHIVMTENTNIPLETVFDFVPTFTRDLAMQGGLLNTGRRGNYHYNSAGSPPPLDLRITNDKNTTLVIGCPIENPNYSMNWLAFTDLADSPYNYLSGNFYDFMENNHATLLPRVNRFAWAVPGATWYDIIDPISPDTASVFVKHSMQTIPVNLILTHNETFAQNYLANGTLPPDAFLFPLDWENLPQNIPTSDDSGDDDNGGDDEGNNENSPTGIEGDPTVDGDPTTTTSKINNNNVYWLQIGQLQSFITWFWTQAGEIIELDDLWNRVIGLYNDLGSAVINVRFFPVNKNYIGGTSVANSIIVGMVECPMAGCEILNKANPTKITLGTQEIPAKYNAFTDYSPYTELQLYLPFHGWISLDVDIFMGNSVRVKAVYDYMSGTCQYLIYVVSNNSEYLVNTCVVKMAVDVPITLQSKSDRDSAIFSNVTNAMGNLIGAGMSIATPSPIGLVMATQNLGVNGSSSAPMKMLGTQGENGAFFAPNRCCIYLKRPSYNRPLLYKSRVGFPCNKGCYLGIAKKNDGTPVAKGFTTVYNPIITFNGNTVGGDIMKPLQTEIDEIYSYLEEGVIL